MRALPGTDPLPPFAGGRPALYLVGPDGEPIKGSPVPLHPTASRSFEAPMGQSTIAEPIADIIPTNASMTPVMPSAPVTVSVPAPIRWLVGFISAIRWLPFAWQLLRSIPSGARQAWKSAFGPKSE